MSDDLMKRLEGVEITAVRASRELMGTTPVTKANEDAYRRRMEDLAIQEGRLARPSIGPPRTRILNRTRAEKVADLAATGMPPCDIAAWLGVTTTLVYYYGRRYSIPIPGADPGSPGPRANRERWRRQRLVAIMRDLGHHPKAIAGTLGVQRRTVANDLWCLDRYGTPTKDEARTGVRKPRQP